ncbi:hypothetical protein [Nitratireductor soli]|uniref:hypothetical protein n=1 Tax=Nitratireductor soli TaxID=1670619 RepID=UPI00065E132D|nr:hypothetical protein [Nitratireductor soli]
MSRTFTILLSIYWTASFAFTAWVTALADGALNAGIGMTSPGGAVWSLAGPLAFILANTLVSVLFLWALVVAMLERGEAQGETEQVARLACSAALAVFLAKALCDAAIQGSGAPVPAESIPLLAILATYLAIRLETREMGTAGAVKLGQPQQMARLNALNAVHGTLLERLATPRDFARIPPANDDRIR